MITDFKEIQSLRQALITVAELTKTGNVKCFQKKHAHIHFHIIEKVCLKLK